MNARPTEIQILVGRLNNLQEIFRVQAEILSCGEEIVEPLAGLLFSEPSAFPEPRVAAAECLCVMEEIGRWTLSFVFSTTMICGSRAGAAVQDLREEIHHLKEGNVTESKDGVITRSKGETQW